MDEVLGAKEDVQDSELHDITLAYEDELSRDAKEEVLVPLDLSMKTKVTKNVIETMETSEDRLEDWKHVFLDSLEEEFYFSIFSRLGNLPLDLSVQKKTSPPMKLDIEEKITIKMVTDEKRKATRRFKRGITEFNPDYDHDDMDDDSDETSESAAEELSESESDVPTSQTDLSGMLGPDDRLIWQEYKELTKKMKMETKMARHNLDMAVMREDPDQYGRPSPWEAMPW